MASVLSPAQLLLSSYGSPTAPSPDDLLRQRRDRRQSRRVSGALVAGASPPPLPPTAGVQSQLPPFSPAHRSHDAATKVPLSAEQQRTPASPSEKIARRNATKQPVPAHAQGSLEWGGDEDAGAAPSHSERSPSPARGAEESLESYELRARQDARRLRASSRSRGLPTASTDASPSPFATSRDLRPVEFLSSSLSGSSASRLRSASASVRRRTRRSQGAPASHDTENAVDGTPAMDGLPEAAAEQPTDAAGLARKREAAREALHADHHLHEQMMMQRYHHPAGHPAGRDGSGVLAPLEHVLDRIAASPQAPGARSPAAQHPVAPPFSLQTSAVIAAASSHRVEASAASLAEDFARLHLSRLEQPHLPASTQRLHSTLASSNTSAVDATKAARAAAEAKSHAILSDASKRLGSGVDKFALEYVEAMESAEKARRFAEEERKRKEAEEIAEAERRKREAVEAAARAKAEAEAAEKRRKEEEEAERKRKADEASAAATATSAPAAGQAPPAAAPVAAAAAQPQDAVSVAKELIRDLTASFGAVTTGMQLPADAYGDGRDPSQLMKAAPDDGNAGKLWLGLRRWANRIIGTLADTREAARNISALFDDATRLDASTNGGSGIAAVQAAGTRYGASTGPYTLYAFDAMVAIACTKASELASGSIGENLTVSFSMSRVLVFLMAKHPLFLRRFLGTLYRAAPILVPAAHFLPGSGATSGISVQELLDKDQQYAARLPKLCAMYAAIMQEHTGGLTEASRAPNSNRNPHPVKNAWGLLARILNGAAPSKPGEKPLFYPGAEIVLHQVLLYCGFELYQSYRKQALKLFQAVAVEYLPKLEAHLQALTSSKSKNTSIEVVRTMLCGPAGPFVPAADHIPVVKDLPSGRELPEDATEEPPEEQ